MPPSRHCAVERRNLLVQLGFIRVLGSRCAYNKRISRGSMRSSTGPLCGNPFAQHGCSAPGRRRQTRPASQVPSESLLAIGVRFLKNPVAPVHSISGNPSASTPVVHSFFTPFKLCVHAVESLKPGDNASQARMDRWISGKASARKRDKRDRCMKTIEKTAIYIQGKCAGWALSNGEFEAAPGWMVENDHIVPASSVQATQNGESRKNRPRSEMRIANEKVSP